MSTADFLLIRPVNVTPAMLTSCTVPESTQPEYVTGTTYAADALVGVSAGTAQAIYRSLQGANTGNAPASSPTWWQFLGTVYAAWSGATTYALGAIVSDLATHQLYESLAAGNLNNPVTTTAKWVPLGATNRWKQFDKVVNSQTVAPGSISQTISAGTLINTLVGLNVDGNVATLTQSQSGYTQTRNLVQHEVNNWYDFFYEEPIRTGDVAFTDIPPYPGSTLTLTITNPGGNVAIGCCFVGKARLLGQTKWDLTGGVLSYSSRFEDQFGNVTLIKRNKAKRLNFEVYIEPGFESEAYRLLDEYTDVEVVVIGSKRHSMTFAYGFLGQWSVPVTNSYKPATIEFKGLT